MNLFSKIDISEKTGACFVPTSLLEQSTHAQVELTSAHAIVCLLDPHFSVV